MSTDLLGEIVSWDTKTHEIALATIREALTIAGLKDDVAGDLNNRSAFSRAAKHLKDQRQIDKVKEDKAGVIRFQLTRKSTRDDVIDFDVETFVTLDSKTGEIDCDNPVIRDQARALFAHAMNVRTATDITRMVQKLFKDNADLFPINPAKGVAYFVPDKFSDFTFRVETFLKGVGGTIWRFPVPKGTVEGNKSVKEAVAAGLQVILDELNDAVKMWDDTTRADTMKRGIEKWRILEHKAKSYGEYLQSEQENLLNKLAVAKAELIGKISEVRPTETAAA